MATHGSSEANFLVMHALLSPGEVVVLDPGCQQLYSVTASIGCKLRYSPLRWENGFAPDLVRPRGARPSWYRGAASGLPQALRACSGPRPPRCPPEPAMVLSSLIRPAGRAHPAHSASIKGVTRR